MRRLSVATAFAVIISHADAVLRGGWVSQAAYISKITLVNADTDREITSVNLGAGGDISLGSLPSTNLNIQAVTQGNVGKVLFNHNGQNNFQSDSVAPFAFCGDNGGNYGTCLELVEGSHSVTATAFVDGQPVDSKTVNFSLTTHIGPDPTSASPPPASPNAALAHPRSLQTKTVLVDAGSSTDSLYGSSPTGLRQDSTGNPIAATDGYEQSIFQTARSANGQFTYTIGGFGSGTSAAVKLGFAELWGGACDPGVRIQNVIVNGEAFLTNYDVGGSAGGCDTAKFEIGAFSANANGVFEIQFVGISQNPLVNLIEIEATSGVTPTLSPATTASPIAAPVAATASPIAAPVPAPTLNDVIVHAGSPTDPYVSSTDPIRTDSSTNPIANAVALGYAEAIFQTARSADGQFTYTIGGFSGGAPATVILGFAELWGGACDPGVRVQNIFVNSEAFLTNYDVSGSAGGCDTAKLEIGTFDANANGTFEIQFIGIIQNPLVNLIDIRATSAVTPTLAPVVTAAIPSTTTPIGAPTLGPLTTTDSPTTPTPTLTPIAAQKTVSPTLSSPGTLVPVPLSPEPTTTAPMPLPQTTAPTPLVPGPPSSLPWIETFASIPNGAQSDGGATAWTATRLGGNFVVQSAEFSVNDGGSEGVLTTSPIQISGRLVAVSLDLRSKGNLETNQDYVRLFVKVDGGNEVLIGEKVGVQSTPTSIAGTGISGNTLVLVVRAYVSYNNEFYFMDNLSVVDAGSAPPPTPAPTQAPSTPRPPTVTPPLSLNGSWQIFQNQDIDGRHEACFVMAGGKAYLIGGRESQDVDVFDPVDRSWSKGSQAPDLLHHMQCVSVGGKIYLAAAWTGYYPQEDNADVMWVYNTANDQWSAEQAIPEPRRRGSAAVVVDGTKIWVSHGNRGGHEKSNFATSYGWIDYYDTVSKTWVLGDEAGFPDAPNPRDHTGGALVNGRICVAGGRDGGLNNWPSVAPTDCFDPISKTWLVEASIPVNRSGSAYGTSCDGKLVVAGGERGISSRVDVFDGQNWSKFTNGLIDSRHGTGLAVDCVRNLIYVASGAPNNGGGNVKSLEIYTP